MAEKDAGPFIGGMLVGLMLAVIVCIALAVAHDTGVTQCLKQQVVECVGRIK